MLSYAFGTIIFTIIFGWISFVRAASINQTDDNSPILPSELPFTIRIELVNDKQDKKFFLPKGIHSFSFGSHNGKWLR